MLKELDKEGIWRSGSGTLMVPEYYSIGRIPLVPILDLLRVFLIIEMMKHINRIFLLDVMC